jgi:hypothetical protein
MTRDDGISEIQDLLNEKLGEFKDSTHETLVDVTERVEAGYVDCIEKLGEFENSIQEILERMLVNAQKQVETLYGKFFSKAGLYKRR